MATDTTIVKAAIYPAIGIARVGNSPEEFYIGPEVPWPVDPPDGFSTKDARGAIKRQAARFRVYGLDASGRVVRELTPDQDTQITWQVHVANKKAAWYEFDVALDIPQAKPVPRRNANVTDRSRLVIDPGPVEITGCNTRGPQHRFDKGKFFTTPVYLGELQTDAKGRLLFLGGHGASGSPFTNNPPTTFANNVGWYDDTSDGPVDAVVVYGGRKLEVEGAWVATAPPDYAPGLVSVQTLYDVIVDALTNLLLPPRSKPSFTHDIFPLLQQFSMTQWVNQGFYASFGYGKPYDFTNPQWLTRLATVSAGDPYQEDRRQIFNSFRPPGTPRVDQRLWPWLYGDNMNNPVTTPNGYFTVTRTIYSYLQQWAAGNFDQDWKPATVPPRSIDAITDPQAQADSLTKAALWFCLGGPFHPGCELTWPMRLPGMYTTPFRIRRRSAIDPEPDYGPVLSPDDFQNQRYFTTPLSICWNSPGTLTRWMAIPWQTDTASCRSGYEEQFDPYVPTFWPTHVPNHVLTEEDYKTVMNNGLPPEERIAAFNKRASWFRPLPGSYLQQIEAMTRLYGDLGMVEKRPGAVGVPELPPVMFVESPPITLGGGASPPGAVAAAPAMSPTHGQIVGAVGKGAHRR